MNDMIQIELALAFLGGHGTDGNGRLIEQYFLFSDEELEGCHDWVQWAFPTDLISKFNPSSGLLPSDPIALTSTQWANSATILNKYLNYLGLHLHDNVIDENEDRFFSIVTSPSNHNILRLSRILRHLVLTGRGYYAFCLLDALLWLVKKHPERFNSDTVAYWCLTCYDFDNASSYFFR